MSVSQFTEWLRPGCDPSACRPRQHDPDSHEAFGYRQAIADPPPTVLEVGPLRIDLRASTVSVDGQLLGLSGREWEVLSYLATHADQWCKSAEIERSIWGFGSSGHPGHMVNVTMCRLRQRLGDGASALVTHPQSGYRLRRDLTSPLPTHGMAAPHTVRPWSIKHDACVWCHETTRPHAGRGLCVRCRSRQRRVGRFT